MDRDVLARAFRAPNGKVAWLPADVGNAIDQFETGRTAISGGCVCLVGGRLLDFRSAEAAAALPDTNAMTWKCERLTGETWQDYVIRSAEVARKSARWIAERVGLEPVPGFRLYLAISSVTEEGAA